MAKSDDNKIEHFNEVVSIVKNDLAFSFIGINNLDELRQQIYQRIAEMINREFELLMSIMYRLDIDEAKFNDAIANTEDPAAQITELIIEREIQKVQTRMRYRNN